jgi:hypothetical protein
MEQIKFKPMDKRLEVLPEIIEGNKLITGFMGYYITPFNGKYHFACKEIKKPEHLNQAWEFRVEEAKYHSSFDWIMPVYFKFRDLSDIQEERFTQHDYWIKKIVEALKYGDKDDCPSKAFVKIVEAIQWYNQQTINQ